VSSVPFIVDPFSVSPPLLYQDYAGNVSVRMTGIPSTASLSNFVLLIGSFVVPQNQMSVITAISRADPSQLLFRISGFSPDSSMSSDSICTLQFNRVSQMFNINVLPTIPTTSLATVSPTFGDSLGGILISYRDAPQGTCDTCTSSKASHFWFVHADVVGGALRTALRRGGCANWELIPPVKFLMAIGLNGAV
jgi:hypothetical protein